MRFFDFHIHPYIDAETLILRYPPALVGMFSPQELSGIGIYAAAGSVIILEETDEKRRMERENAAMYALYDAYPETYVPGLRINPLCLEESLQAVEEAYKKGVRLIGELTPYLSGGWSYTDCAEIFDLCQEKGMVISCHPTTHEDMTAVCKQFPRLPFVFAHPGEHDTYMLHLERMEMCENAYLDLSGTGLFRNGMLRYGIDRVGAERILFGTDFPVCNPGMYTGGVLFESLSEHELSCIAYKNAERLLQID